MLLIFGNVCSDPLLIIITEQTWGYSLALCSMEEPPWYSGTPHWERYSSSNIVLMFCNVITGRRETSLVCGAPSHICVLNPIRPTFRFTGRAQHKLCPTVWDYSRFSRWACSFQWSLARWTSMTDVFHGMFHCWVNSGLVQNCFRQVKLKQTGSFRGFWGCVWYPALTQTINLTQGRVHVGDRKSMKYWPGSPHPQKPDQGLCVAPSFG